MFRFDPDSTKFYKLVPDPTIHRILNLFIREGEKWKGREEKNVKRETTIKRKGNKRKRSHQILFLWLRPITKRNIQRDKSRLPL